MRSIGFLLALVALAGCGTGTPDDPKPTPPQASTTTIAFATYLGNDLADTARDLALDASGNLYVVGGAHSADLLPGSPVVAFAGDEDAFVAKLDPTGAVLWWTFLGGAGPDRANAVDLDGLGGVIVGGGAAAGFPVTGGAVLPTFQGGASSATDPARDGFVAKLDGANGTLTWSTYFGGGGTDLQTSVVRDVAANSSGIYVVAPTVSGAPPTGQTTISENLPAVIVAALQNGYQPTRPAGIVHDPDNTDVAKRTVAANLSDGLLARLSSDGAQLAWATYLGGGGAEGIEFNVRLGAGGNPTVLLRTAGGTELRGNPLVAEPIVEPGAYDETHNGASDFYLATFSSDGATRLGASYVGGGGDETLDANNLAIRANGDVVIAAGSTSKDFPTVGVPPAPDGWDPNHNGSAGSFPYAGDCVIFVITPDLETRVGSTFYGGGNGDACSAVGSDGSNNVYVAGGTRSNDIPTDFGPHETSRPAALSAFAAVFSADLAKLRYGTYFGGSGGSNANALVVRGLEHFTFGGDAGEGWPLPASPPPARGPLTGTTQHGAVADVTVVLGPG